MARLPLPPAQQRGVFGVLVAQMNGSSSIANTMAIQALFDLAQRYPVLQPFAPRHLQELTVIGTPAMTARGRKPLHRLNQPKPSRVAQTEAYP